MALLDDLKEDVRTIFAAAWTTREGQVVPDPEDLKLTNDAIKFARATILYADLTGSTALVDSKGWQYAAEIYKTYLLCAAKLIRAEGGVITSYDGDRVMGIFIGDSQSRPAARCGLKINYAVGQIINPALAKQYPNESYTVRQVVGIDTSSIKAARTGVRGGNDIVWVGRAANHAAKLTNLNMAERTWITKEVYNRLGDDEKFGSSDKTPMWKKYTWSQNNGEEIYGSTWHWRP